MQLHIELTKTMNFAGWEGGSFNSNYNTGRAVLLAKPDAEKLDVLFDHHPLKSPNHFLFILDTGYLVAQVQISVQRPRGRNKPIYKMRLTLSRITKLYTENVQGHAVCKADCETMWAIQMDYEAKEKMQELAQYEPTLLGYREEFKHFMQAAIEKAMTSREDQHLFWGTPRRLTENV